MPDPTRTAEPLTREREAEMRGSVAAADRLRALAGIPAGGYGRNPMVELLAEIDALRAQLAAAEGDPRMGCPLDGFGSHRQDLIELRLLQGQVAALTAELLDRRAECSSLRNENVRLRELINRPLTVGTGIYNAPPVPGASQPTGETT